MSDAPHVLLVEDNELVTSALSILLESVGARVSVAGSVTEALAFANDTRYGLAAYLFTRDISRAIALGERLDFGMVGINRGIMADPAAPH